MHDFYFIATLLFTPFFLSLAGWSVLYLIRWGRAGTPRVLLAIALAGLSFAEPMIAINIFDLNFEWRFAIFGFSFLAGATSIGLLLATLFELQTRAVELEEDPYPNS